MPSAFDAAHGSKSSCQCHHLSTTWRGLAMTPQDGNDSTCHHFMRPVHKCSRKVSLPCKESNWNSAFEKATQKIPTRAIHCTIWQKQSISDQDYRDANVTYHWLIVLILQQEQCVSVSQLSLHICNPLILPIANWTLASSWKIMAMA
jgi:hypothetical protein